MARDTILELFKGQPSKRDFASPIDSSDRDQRP